MAFEKRTDGAELPGLCGSMGVMMGLSMLWRFTVASGRVFAARYQGRRRPANANADGTIRYDPSLWSRPVASLFAQAQPLRPVEGPFSKSEDLPTKP